MENKQSNEVTFFLLSDIENGGVDTGGEGEGGMNGEIRFDINTLLCVKQIASGNLCCSTESSARCSVVT